MVECCYCQVQILPSGFFCRLGFEPAPKLHKPCALADAFFYGEHNNVSMNLANFNTTEFLDPVRNFRVLVLRATWHFYSFPQFSWDALVPRPVR